ncbi:BLUF domain-containing protein [Sphingomonas sp. LHG3406-1]|uniref:BLUF domain-containing protein n=1 Tax=Sphingomonas sp. LHG3406-1 TaxID=2804617 RepID=UPI00260B8921|nr:BLUF domain-containing protein [Sphingomonas sp. LHG3406-1]
MQYKRLAYTSLAALDLSVDQLFDIGQTARDLNALDGVTGLLLFNGTHFLQWVEGAPETVDELMERLRRDQRHSAVEVRETQLANDRLFPDWSMKLVRVRSELIHAHDDVLQALPAGLPDSIRERIAGMVELISVEV